MPRNGRPKAPLALTDDERATLDWWARRPKSPVWLAQRSSVVLACADGLGNVEVAAQLGLHPATVGKWRARFVAARLAGLSDAPRSGAPRTLTPASVERVLLSTFTGVPPGATHSSTRQVAQATGVSASSVGRIWRDLGLAPWEDDAVTLARDPALLAPLDVAALYLHPPYKVAALRPRRSPPAAGPPADAVAALAVLGPVVRTPGTGPRARPRGFAAFVAAAHAAAGRGSVDLLLDSSTGQDSPAARDRLTRLPGLRVHTVPSPALWLAVVARGLVGSPHRLGGLRAELECWARAARGTPLTWQAPSSTRLTSDAAD